METEIQEEIEIGNPNDPNIFWDRPLNENGLLARAKQVASNNNLIKGDNYVTI